MLAREVRNREVGAHNAAGELRFGVLQSFATLRFSPILATGLYFVTDTTDTDMQNLMHKISTQNRTHAQNRNSKACMG